MPIQSRCPSCAAAIPSGAAWCSLCHADLRSRRGPVTASRSVDDVLPGSAAPVSASDLDDPDPEPVGRREAGRHAQGSGGTGRRVAGSAVPTRTIERSSDPASSGTPSAEVDEIAEQMLAQLAVSERSQRMFDPDDVPGGKWTVVFAGGAGVVLVLLSLFAVLGALLNR